MPEALRSCLSPWRSCPRPCAVSVRLQELFDLIGGGTITFWGLLGTWLFWLELLITAVCGIYWAVQMNRSLALYDPPLKNIRLQTSELNRPTSSSFRRAIANGEMLELEILCVRFSSARVEEASSRQRRRGLIPAPQSALRLAQNPSPCAPKRLVKFARAFSWAMLQKTQ